MKLAIEIIKREIAQREHANKHNHLRKDEVNAEIESLQKVVNFISSNPMLADSSKTDSETEFLDAIMDNIKKYYPKKCKIQF